MGQGFPQAVTVKNSGDGDEPTKGLAWGYSDMQGWRVSMEDAHFTLPFLGEEGWRDTAAFGVMDGHGGAHVARFCEMYLPSQICQGSCNDPCGALVDAFHRIDELLNQCEFQSDASPQWIGCTANVCLIRPHQIVVANAGDTRSVLSRGGRAVPLSEDHKPNHPVEKGRIENAGGTVERFQYGPHVQYRVNGNLNLSRSIGDLQYKKNESLLPSEQMICATPDVRTFPREAEDEFIIVACDGIWDMIGCQDAVDFIRGRLYKGCVLSSVAEELLDHCISPDLQQTNGLGGDNMTAIIITLAGRGKGVQTPFGQVPHEPPPDPAIAAMHGGSPMGSDSYIDDNVVTPVGLCGCKMASPR